MLRLRLLSCLCCLCGFALVQAASPAEARKRYALVVGINDDPVVAAEHKKDPLTKPEPDARAVRDALSKRFVVELLDSPAKTTRAHILERWKALLKKLAKDDVILFYFAGHGLEFRGQNYLRASDSPFLVKEPSDINSTVDLQQMLAELSYHQRPGSIGVFILDTCRQNPKDWTGAQIVGGPSPLKTPPEVFVMYSAGIGQLAMEASDQPHSLFAGELLPLLAEEDAALSDLAQKLRRNVIHKAITIFSRPQNPAIYDQLSRSRTLNGDPAEPIKYDGNQPFRYKTESLQSRDTLIECEFCPEMIVIPTGQFTLGTEGDSGVDASEMPARKLHITKRLAVAKHEVTVREWNKCADDPDEAVRCRGRKPLSSSTRPLHPVTGVTFEDAQRFAAWVSKVTNAPYRLPTEAEWEYAARARSKGSYSFSDEPNPERLTDAERLCRYANGADLSTGVPLDANLSCNDGNGRGPAQVGSYLPNKFGLFDVHGNVWEWVQDCWHASYAGDGVPEDASAWIDAEGKCASGRRVARGGSWRSDTSALRSAARHAFPDDHSRSTIGFRLVRDIHSSQ